MDEEEEELREAREVIRSTASQKVLGNFANKVELLKDAKDAKGGHFEYKK